MINNEDTNVCCPYFVVIGCVDTDKHCHIACRGSTDDTPAISNKIAKITCLGKFEDCPLRPRIG